MRRKPPIDNVMTSLYENKSGRGLGFGRTLFFIRGKFTDTHSLQEWAIQTLMRHSRLGLAPIEPKSTNVYQTHATQISSGLNFT